MPCSRFRSSLFIAATCAISLAPGVVSAEGPAPIADEPIAGAAVVINEIMFDPAAVYDSRGEWIELHNTSGTEIDLDGWTIGDETYDRHTIDSLTVPAGGFVVLARFGETERNGGVVADHVYGDRVLLFNVGDQIALRDAGGTLIDVVDYAAAGFERPNGRSLSLRDPALDNADGRSWCTATTTMRAGDHGSPGRENECRSSTAKLVIDEIMNNPSRTSDPQGEWFELVNVGDRTIDLAGFSVQDDDGERFTIDRSVAVEPGKRIVVAHDAAPLADAGIAAVEYGDAMRLHNSFDELVVTDALGIEIDAVRWNDGRTFPDPSGASMQLRSSGADNADGANWCESRVRAFTGDRGTPGAHGTCDHAEVPSLVITEIMFDPEQSTGERAGEWFEVTNVGSTDAVLDGVVVRASGRTHTLGELRIAAGGRAVLAAVGDPSVNGGVTPDAVYGRGIPLYNTIATLELIAPTGDVIDRVRRAPWSGFPSESGHSIELIDVGVDNALGANWCVATERYGAGDFGTPGAPSDCGRPAPPPPLRISEIMRNPAAVQDSVGEWFELHNPTADPVDLLHWSVGDRRSEQHIISESVVVPAEGYIVIARSGDTARNGGVTADHVTGPAMVLMNNADSLTIRDRHGQTVDEVSWTRDSLFPRPNGGSASLAPAAIDSGAASTDVSQWCVTDLQFGAGDRGTPGRANDCPDTPHRAIVINEIHRDPAAVPDARGEWFELHNTGDTPIDIAGWTLRDDDVDSVLLDPSRSLVIDAGGYLVVARNGASLNGGVEATVLVGSEMPLYNTEDEIVLLDDQLTVVDRVAWTAVNGFPKIAGAAMALRDPDLDNAVGSNWCAAVTEFGEGDFGTPGAANTCERPTDPEPPMPTDATHAAFATASGACAGSIQIAGSKIDIGRSLRSNGALTLAGSKVDVGGDVSYATSLSLPKKVDVRGEIIESAAAESLAFGWRITDFAPDGRIAEAAADRYHYRDRDWTVQSSTASITPGVYYVEGDVRINTSVALLNGVTIVATGTIEISASRVSVDPFASDLPSLLSGDTGCAGAGITLRASQVASSGALFAPDAPVTLEGSKVALRDAAIVGSSVTIRASKIELAD